MTVEHDDPIRVAHEAWRAARAAHNDYLGRYVSIGDTLAEVVNMPRAGSLDDPAVLARLEELHRAEWDAERAFVLAIAERA